MMNQWLLILIMGLVGAVIGWITNLLAIRLLFRPYQAIHIPLLGWRLQGLIPKRQAEIAAALGNVVSTELITGDDVAVSLGKEEIKQRLLGKIDRHVQERVMTKLPVLIPAAFQLRIADIISKSLHHEVSVLLENPVVILQEDDLDHIKDEIYSIVKNKVNSFDVRRLEELTYLIAKKELKHIELLGGFLGFLIGLMQGMITIVFF